MRGFQVGPETFITIQYQVFDAEGDAASVPEVLGCVFGMGGLLPEVERALDGKVAGDRFSIKLSEKQAYGARNAQGILEIERSEFPEDVAAGDRFEVENEQGGLLVLHVLEVDAEVVVVDTNHPLAGQEVEIAIEVLEVRPATGEEVEAALQCLEDDDAASPSARPDVAVSHLVRRRPSG